MTEIAIADELIFLDQEGYAKHRITLRAPDYENRKGCDISYAPAISSCEEAYSVDAADTMWSVKHPEALKVDLG